MELFDTSYVKETSHSNEAIMHKFMSLNKTFDTLEKIKDEIKVSMDFSWADDRLKGLLEHIPAGVCLVDRLGDIIIHNSHFFDIMEMEASKGNILLSTKNCFFATDLQRFLKQPAKNEFSREGRIYDMNENPRDIFVRVGQLANEGIIYIILTDITEKNQMIRDISRSSRLMAMGDMVAQISHEIKNPLGSMELFATLLYKDLDNEDSRKLLNNIIIMIKRLDSILNSMLNFAKPMKQVFMPVNINDIIKETVQFTSVLTSERNIELATDLCCGTAIIDVDPELIRQVIYNLLLNSYQASEKNGSITISTATCKDKRDGREMFIITIEDQGYGIEQRHLNSIFDPFFTTRNDGNGLGLSIVNRIVDIHNGYLKIKSTKNKGTHISVFLPRQQRKAKKRRSCNESAIS